MRPGDWICPDCGDTVFASKNACRCGKWKPASTGGNTSTARPGDWNCPSCKGLVFASKSQCRCGTMKPSNVTNQLTASSSSVGSSPFARSTDWICPSCHDNVFGSRSNCRCGQSKPSVPTTTAPAIVAKPGDWICLKCNDIVFASKAVCRCGENKPATGGNALRPDLTVGSFPSSSSTSTMLPLGSNPASVASASASVSSRSPVTPSVSAPFSPRPGDWVCPKCHDNVFASKSHCRCGEMKPAVIVTPTTADASSKECAICMANPRNVLFKNCGHVCVCKECITRMTKKECPVCRTAFRPTDVINVVVS